MTNKITKIYVDKLKPANRDTFYFDNELKGFALKVNAGGKKTYIVQYRIHGRKRRYTIGSHGSPWTPDSAREKAKKILGQVANGIDPSEEKEAAKKDITIADLCDLYLNEGCLTKSPNTIATDKGRIERHIKPLLGSRTLKSITTASVEMMMSDVASGKTKADIKTGFRGRAIVSGGKGTASKCVALMSTIFNFAVKRQLIAENPAQGISKFKDNKRERYLTSDEFKRLGEALIAEKHLNPYALAAIKVLMLTGLRKNEVIYMRWNDLWMEQGVIVIPKSKTGKKFIPLTEPVTKIINELPRVEGCEFIFVGKGQLPYQGIPKVWNKIRKAAGLEDVRLHDLRHSFASVGAMSGESLYILGKLLGHSDQATTQRYAHVGNNPLTNAAKQIAEKISQSLNVTEDNL